MATNSEQNELFKTIWDIANDLRGKVDGWDFKAYVLGTIFYRYISENLTSYINRMQQEAGVKDFDYSRFDDETAREAKEQLVEEKGFFILPSQLFCNVAAHADEDENLNETLSKIFRAIEASAMGSAAEEKIRGLFSDFIIDNSKIGGTIAERNRVFAAVITKVRDMRLSGDIQHNRNDVFGDAYEYLMKMYAANAGKSGGEYFTPQEVSELLVLLVTSDGRRIESVYDPACGSGSLLLKFRKVMGGRNRTLRYYGQEVNPTTHNLCRINMFLHDVNYNNFDIQLGDTLLRPLHLGMHFDAIVSNPPYSLKWVGDANPILINDERYSPAGVLAPKKNADLAFVMHMLYHLKPTGTCAIVEFPGVLYRSGTEREIRKYLVEKNYVHAVIQLPANLFFGVSIATCIIVLKKDVTQDADCLFIDASREFVKSANKNHLTEENIRHIHEIYIERSDRRYVARLVPKQEIIDNNFNLSVSSYVEQEDTREKIDIEAVNKRLVGIVKKNRELQKYIDELIIKGL